MKLFTSIFFALLFYISSVSAETIPSIEIINYKDELAYIIVSAQKVVVGSDYQDACNQLITYGYAWKVIPSKRMEPACYNPASNLVLGADTWYCADGSLAYYNAPWWSCNVFHSCPNSTWTLSSDKLRCTRPKPDCDLNPSEVSEMKLLAAIIYGEASVNSPYEEKAAIANAIIRYRNANNFKSVNQLIAKRKFYSSAVLNKVVRYRLVMCSDIESEYPDLYKASMNALDPKGIDYANGGCFWDGVDLKTKGRDQPHYQFGYIFTNPAHDVFSIGDSEPAHRFGEFGNYDYTYESTAGYGKTVFWKLTKEFLNAKRGKQCH